MNQQTEVLKILNVELTRIRSRNPEYSLRSYAKKLQLSPSTLSGILAGRLSVTKRMAEKILRSLCIDPVTSVQLLSQLTNKASKNKTRKMGLGAEVDRSFAQFNMDQFYLISDWWYFGIMSLAETEDFSDDPKWISKRLGIGIPETKIALERLERMDLLARAKNGKLLGTGKSFKTTSDIANLSLRKSHFQTVELVKQSLEQDALEECDFTAITMPMDPAKIPEAKRRIADFRRSLMAFLEEDKKKEVYRVFIGFFPLSKRENLRIKSTKGNK
jgi:uncharacterized protein (TIGR02147 family)